MYLRYFFCSATNQNSSNTFLIQLLLRQTAVKTAVLPFLFWKWGQHSSRQYLPQFLESRQELNSQRFTSRELSLTSGKAWSKQTLDILSKTITSCKELAQSASPDTQRNAIRFSRDGKTTAGSACQMNCPEDAHTDHKAQANWPYAMLQPSRF